jgi:acetylornithine deacetylase/succinyl-diaminopimelate desuccinylase-like protein
VRLNETTRTYFARLAAISPPEVATHYRDVLHSHRARAAAQYLSRREPANASMLRTTIVPTVIRAGFRSNVIPSDAEALLDIRALPDEDIAELTNHLRRLINDPGIDLIPRGHNRPTAAPSRADTPAFAAIERVQQNMYPEATTLPAMLTGATDLAQLRARGVQAYGLGPCSDESESGPHGAHGDEERVSERALLSFCEFLWRAVIEIAGMSA